jgi:hypothetical protein
MYLTVKRSIKIGLIDLSAVSSWTLSATLLTSTTLATHMTLLLRFGMSPTNHSAFMLLMTIKILQVWVRMPCAYIEFCRALPLN